MLGSRIRHAESGASCVWGQPQMESLCTPYRAPAAALLGDRAVTLLGDALGTLSSHELPSKGTAIKADKNYLCRSRMSMRFHPKSRASTDQAPGPSSAREAPRVPSRIYTHGSPECENVLHSSITTTIVPAMGVHNPANRSIPAPAARTCSVAATVECPPRSVMPA